MDGSRAPALHRLRPPQVGTRSLLRFTSLRLGRSGAQQSPSCLGKLSGGWWRLRAIDAVAATATATDDADTHLWFCTAKGVCPSFVRSTPDRWDGAHLTSAYASSLGSEMARFMAQVMR
jgi:hypothetical protein